MPIEQLDNNLDRGPCNLLALGEGVGTAQTTHKNMTGGMMDEGHESQFSRANKTSPSCVTTMRLMGRKLADVDCRLDSGRIPTGSGSNVGTSGCSAVLTGGQLKRREGGASRLRPPSSLPCVSQCKKKRQTSITKGSSASFDRSFQKLLHPLGTCFSVAIHFFYVLLSQPGVKCTFHQGY